MDDYELWAEEMMSLFQRAIFLVSYKPGWKFDLERTGPVSLTLTITCRTADPVTAAPVKLVNQQAVELVTVPRPRAEALDWFVRRVFDAIDKFESHERLEWFKIDGRCPYPAHAGPVSFSTPTAISPDFVWPS